MPRNQIDQVAKETGAIAFDAPGVELGHHEGRCSFESIILKYDLKESVCCGWQKSSMPRTSAQASTKIRSRADSKQLPAATVCASRIIRKTCNTNLKSMTRCTHGGVTLADGLGLQPGNITVTEQGLVIGFVVKQR